MPPGPGDVVLKGCGEHGDTGRFIAALSTTLATEETGLPRSTETQSM